VCDTAPSLCLPAAPASLPRAGHRRTLRQADGRQARVLLLLLASTLTAAAAAAAGGCSRCCFSGTAAASQAICQFILPAFCLLPHFPRVPSCPACPLPTASASHASTLACPAPASSTQLNSAQLKSTQLQGGRPVPRSCMHTWRRDCFRAGSQRATGQRRATGGTAGAAVQHAAAGGGSGVRAGAGRGRRQVGAWAWFGPMGG
jgi:hypothetical protein